MPPPLPSKTPEPEDIFSGTGAARSGSAYPVSPETTASIAESPARGFGRKLVRLLFLALGAAVIVGAGYFGYHYFFAAPAIAPVGNGNANQPVDLTNQPVNANANTPVNSPEVNVNLNAPEPNINSQQPIVNNPVLAPQDDPNSTVDTDHDGLTDYQEVHVYHTDPLKADTDADGLSDRDEVMVWHTDPLNPDTDGDGYKDGDEVKNGFNPLGPGKLLTPPIAPL
jgi:Bacterial TSP3 repeat